MTQNYTPVAWQDETTSQQGTLINAERLNQMQTAHHFADGLEEVDAVPTADPGVEYHKIVYCTADSTLYRWDGTQWTADIDDETKRLLEEEIARATEAERTIEGYLDAHEANHSNPHVVTKAQVGLGNCDNTADLDKPISTATQAALDGKADKATTLAGYGITDAYTKSQADALLANKADKADTYTKSQVDGYLGGKVDKLGSSPAGTYKSVTVNAQGQVTAGTNPTTLSGYGITDAYTKGEADTLLAGKADQATTYTKTETDTLLASKANDDAVVKLTGNQTMAGIKNFIDGINVPSTGKTSIWAGDSGTFTLNAAGGGYNRITCKNSNRTIDLAVDANVLRVPTPPEGASSLGAVNIAYLDGYLPMVRTTGNQDILGMKTFEYVIHKEFITKDSASVGANTWRRLYNMATSSSGSNRHVTIEMPSTRGTSCAILDIMWGGLTGAPTAEVVHRGTPIEIRVCRATDGHLEVWTNDHVYTYVTFEGIRTAGQINVVTAALSPADTTEPEVGETYSAVVTPTVIQ